MHLSTTLRLSRVPVYECQCLTAIRRLFGCCIIAAVLLVPVPWALSSQSRDLCDKCCRESGLDDYYFEQCKLKCFRNPDHCVDRRATNAPSAPPPPQATPQRTLPPAQESPSGPPAAVTQPNEPAPRTSKPSRRDIVFRWPESLILTPGRELDAAGQILMANGIAPQHPNFPLAAKAIEGVLVDFARRNPTGGDLPTDQLERILMQYR